MTKNTVLWCRSIAGEVEGIQPYGDATTSSQLADNSQTAGDGLRRPDKAAEAARRVLGMPQERPP